MSDILLKDQLHKREEEHARERKNLLDQLEKERRLSEKEKTTLEKKDLEVRTKPVFGVLKKRGSNQSPQLHRLSRNLKFRW